jgi:uncharacterized membrane protein YphA (DoxX/SURF4 family)
MKPKVSDTIYLAARLILGGVFVYASLDKITHPMEFAQIVYNYKILPAMWVNPVALIIPFVELTAGIALIIGRPAFPSALILTGFVVVFAMALGFNLARGLDFQCGCFSTSVEARNAGINTLIRDVILLIPASLALHGAARRVKQ